MAILVEQIILLELSSTWTTCNLKKKHKQIENEFSVSKHTPSTSLPTLELGIDDFLEYNSLFCLHDLAYVARDCLFDSLKILLHFMYTSLELWKGTIEYLRSCLQAHDTKALTFYQNNLNK